jgi:hypothetical protein
MATLAARLPGDLGWHFLSYCPKGNQSRAKSRNGAAENDADWPMIRKTYGALDEVV